MKLESNGILIGLRPFNERDAIARVFSRGYGVLVGVMRGAVVAKKNRPLLGQVGQMSWNARLDSQLGTFHWEADKNLAAPLMMSHARLAAMNAAFELLNTLLPEREAYDALYDKTLWLMGALGDDVNGTYLEWETDLLRELGYALDLSHCSGCGKTNDLHFLSPRTGRAVCVDCAAPYVNRLYKLPLSIGITLRFIEGVCAQQGVAVPVMRQMLNMVE